MTGEEARLEQSAIHTEPRQRSHSHAHRSRRRKKQGHLLHRLILNLCLLTGGCLLLGTAFHYYYRGDFEEPKTSPESVARSEHDYLLAGLYCVLGFIPLGLGIWGEAIRKRDLDI